MAGKATERNTSKAQRKSSPKKSSSPAARKVDPTARTTKTPAKMGRPRIIETAEEMAAAIDAYFDSLKPTKNQFPRAPTMAGLALALGFKNRQSIWDCEKRPEFSDVIAAARLRIESHHEERLSGSSPVGSVFWLKNHAAYRDSVEHTGPNGGAIEVSLIKRIVVDPNVR